LNRVFQSGVCGKFGKFLESEHVHDTLHTAVYGGVVNGGRDMKDFHFWMQPVYGIVLLLI